MQALILAAGRGERMRPLTDTTPKPLLRAGGKSLLEYHVEHLAAAGITDLVINHARFGDQIEAAMGDGSCFGVSIHYSPEGDNPLETGGGIRHALALIDSDPFLVVNADVYSDFPFAPLAMPAESLAHLVLVDNPDHNPGGDFSLDAGRVGLAPAPCYTYSGIGLYRPALFAATAPGAFPLAPLLRSAATRGEVSGQYYAGIWVDVGTPERLQALDRQLGQDSPAN
ncbi:MAG: nucleotidyltransferase family protein [Gammaproteobacteria bacterium]|nr:nucleotidyltransferase family protein [Gammaproteobacteria bacterium]